MRKYIARIADIQKGQIQLRRATKKNIALMEKIDPGNFVFINASSKRSAIEKTFIVFREKQKIANEVVKIGELQTELSGIIEIPSSIEDGILNLTCVDGVLYTEPHADFLREGDTYG